jgi:WD40 repeat protein
MKKEVSFNEFNPFPGLRPFAPDDSDLFFGRDVESEEVIGKLLKNRYVTVLGASGIGKSSLISCGVLPKIRNLKTGESSLFKIISLRPGNDPFGNLVRALSESKLDSGQDKSDRNKILSDFHDNYDNFASLFIEYMIKTDDKILLVIDQFEELFRYGSASKSGLSQTPQAKFADFIVETITRPVINVFIIIAMRSEFIGECAHYPGLTKIINNSNYLVPNMGTENYREVIEGPVNFSGASIDPILVEVLLNEVGDGVDQLSVLQHALMRTWSHWKKLDEPDRPINKTDYEAIGAIRKAISVSADEVFEELNKRGKEICEIMFKAITRKGSDNKGVRHPSDIETIKTIAGCTTEELIEVIEKFRSPGRDFILPAQSVNLSESSVIDLYNDSFIRSWERLRDWVNLEASSMQIYQGLSEASALYQQGKASLYRPPDLNLAINWRDRNKPSLAWALQYNPAFERAMVYLRTSEKAYLEEEQNKFRLQKRKVKRIRLMAITLGIVSVVAIGLILFVFVRKKTAERQIFLAEKQKIVADSTAAIAIRYAQEAREQKIVSDIQKSFAEKDAREALLQKNIAVEQSEHAKKAILSADKTTKAAIEQRNEALRLRMLSIGKSMAIKSLQLTGEKDLQTLLAYQAYLFNKTNRGPDNDADIYAGLYNVSLQYGAINFRSFTGHNSDIKSLAFIPGKNEFFTSGNDGKVLKWSLDRKDQTLQVVYSGNDIIDVLAVSPDASWLACGSTNATIKMIPLKGNNIGYEMTGHNKGIKSLIFSYDGKYLYSAALDGKVLKWDIAARTSTNITTGSMEITSIDISSRGNYLAGISSDGNVVVWDPEHNSDNFKIETTGKNIKVVKFYPGNNLLALGDMNGDIELWDINLRKKISKVKAHMGQVNDIQFNTALKQMATAGNDKKIKIFNITDPGDLSESPVSLNDNEGFVLVMKFSPDGQMIISGESGGINNLRGRPSNVDYLVSDICNIVSRNLTKEEWNNYVGKDIPPEKTCPDKNYNIKVEPIKSLNK